jgi:hypothetical protein
MSIAATRMWVGISGSILRWDTSYSGGYTSTDGQLFKSDPFMPTRYVDVIGEHVRPILLYDGTFLRVVSETLA